MKRAIAHALLTAVVTAKILVLILLDARYLTLTENAFKYIFSVNSQNSFGSENILFFKTEVISNLDKTVETYNNLANTTIGSIQYREKGTCSSQPNPDQMVKLSYLVDNAIDSQDIPISHFAQVLQNLTLNTFPGYLQSVSFDFPLCSYRAVGNSEDCFEWHLRIVYRYVSQIAVSVTIDSNVVSTCSGKESVTQKILVWLEALAIAVGIPYLVIVGKVRSSIDPPSHVHNYILSEYIWFC